MNGWRTGTSVSMPWSLSWWKAGNVMVSYVNSNSDREPAVRKCWDSCKNLIFLCTCTQSFMNDLSMYLHTPSRIVCNTSTGFDLQNVSNVLYSLYWYKCKLHTKQYCTCKDQQIIETTHSQFLLDHTQSFYSFALILFFPCLFEPFVWLQGL